MVDEKLETVVARIDERTAAQTKRFNAFECSLKSEIREIKNSLKLEYVTKEEFKLVSRIVYRAVGFTSLSVLAAVVALVVVR